MDVKRLIRRLHNVTDMWLAQGDILLDPRIRERMQIQITEAVESAVCAWREERRVQREVLRLTRDHLTQ